VIRSKHETECRKKNSVKGRSSTRGKPETSRSRLGGGSSIANSSGGRPESDSAVGQKINVLNEKRLVIDANVLILAYLPESALLLLPPNLTDVVRASALFLLRAKEKKIVLYMPSSAFLEVFVGYWDYVRSDVVSEATMLEIFKRIERRKLEFRQVDLSRSFELAVQLKRVNKPQDAIYAALAESLKIPLVTNDSRLLNNAKQNKIDLIGFTPLELFS
jgi:predicted nucleic acid-binding protein